jgi:ribosomal protein S18 acetylase RimI-like enzyme
VKTTYIIKEVRAIADLLYIDYSPHSDAPLWLITRINVPKAYRRLGHGTLLLQWLCLDADREGETLLLEVSPSDGPGVKPLIAWYKKYCFKPVGIGEASRVLIRYPKVQSQGEQS